MGMDDVNAGVEEHKEAGAMSKWWSGVKSSKMATAVGNNRAVQALTYVSAPRPMTHMGCHCMPESATVYSAFRPPSLGHTLLQVMQHSKANHAELEASGEVRKGPCNTMVEQHAG